MTIKFKAHSTVLNAAMDVVSIVPPRPIVPQGSTGQGNAGFLFVVRGEVCFVYSQDTFRVARASFPITDVEGEGAFIFPAQYTDAFKFTDGDIGFTAKSEGDTHTVRIDLHKGGGGERTSFDPRLLATCDRDLEAATNPREFPAAVLREGFTMSAPFMAKEKETHVEEHYKTIQIFDGSTEALAKADGYMFGSNSIQAFYFQCDAFKGKGLAIHGQHLSMFTSFLAKADGIVTIKTGSNRTFAIDSRGRVFGWTHHSRMFEKFSYYSAKMDKVILNVPKAEALNAMAFTRSQLDSKRDKIRFEYDAETKSLRLLISENDSKFTSPMVSVPSPEGAPQPVDVKTDVNIDHLTELFKGSKAGDIELRIAILPPGDNSPKEKVMFRTIDEFWLSPEGNVVGGSNVPEGKEPAGAFKCRVTRFMPNKS